jgi:hypothetical protein
MRYFFYLFLWVSLFSCRTPEEAPTFAGVVVNNAWKVGYSRDNSNVFTSVYAGWLFNFNADGSCVVTGGGNTINGTWKENAPARKLTLFLNSSALPAVFASREWEVVFLTPLRIKLADNRFSPTQELYLDKP